MLNQRNIFFLFMRMEACRRGERGGKAAGLARAGTEEGWRRSDLALVLHKLASEKGWRRLDLAAPDLGVGATVDGKAISLARVGAREG
jgi:hypothetical protein